LGSLDKWEGIYDKSYKYKYKVKSFILHPNFPIIFIDHINFTQYDIALIEMENPIETKSNSTHFTLNGICLPKQGILNSNKELAQFSG
jgi:hypothetical protein